MMKLPRLIRGELNKIFMRPILYILTGFLVLSIVLSVTVYKPNDRNEYNNYYYDNCKTLIEVDEIFNSTDISKTKSKAYADDLLQGAKDDLNAYNNNMNTNSKGILLNNLLDIESILEDYRTLINNFVTGGSTDNIEKIRQNLVNAVTEFQSQYNSYANSTVPLFIVKKTNHENMDELLTILLNLLKQQNSSDFGIIITHETICSNIYETGIINEIKKYVNEIVNINLTHNKFTQLESYIETAENYMIDLNNKFNSLVLEADDSQLSLGIKYAKDYFLVAYNVNNLISNELYYYPVSGFNDDEIHEYLGYDGVYGYQLRETIVKQTYLVTTNNVITDFSDVFSSGQTSNNTKNAFDFVYFGLEIFGFIIIIFAVILGAGMVAGESSAGTLKLLAIRPYSRSKILTSKLIATMIISFIFAFFSAILLFLIGYALYGVNLSPVLGVFNATTAFTMSPIFLILIYLLCLMFKILIYTIFAIAISVLFRSNVAAVCISIVFYFFSSIFNLLFSTSSWYTYWPFCNVDLFKYLGGSFISSSANNPITLAFSSPILYNSSFFLSLAISLILGLVCVIIAYVVFNKREIK